MKSSYYTRSDSICVYHLHATSEYRQRNIQHPLAFDALARAWRGIPQRVTWRRTRPSAAVLIRVNNGIKLSFSQGFYVRTNVRVSKKGGSQILHGPKLMFNSRGDHLVGVMYVASSKWRYYFLVHAFLVTTCSAGKAPIIVIIRDFGATTTSLHIHMVVVAT